MYLGIVRANPVDYSRKFADELVEADRIPTDIRSLENPHGLILAADVREGLGEYKSQVQALNNSHVREYLSPNSAGRDSLVFNNAIGVNNHDVTSHVVVARSPLSHLHSPTSLPITSSIINQNQIVPN